MERYNYEIDCLIFNYSDTDSACQSNYHLIVMLAI